MQLGFIGTGSMGSILIEAFLAEQALLPSQIVVYNRTPSKAQRLAELHPGLRVASDNADVVRQSDIILICVKPADYRQAWDQFGHVVTPDKILVTITSPISLAEMEALTDAPVARAVPSITNAASSGLTLLEFGTKILEEHRKTLLRLFSFISHPVEIQEKFLRISSDISSCGPAFLSFVLQQMIRAAHEETGISIEAASFLTEQMVIGFAELLKQGQYTLPELQRRVCVPGGITGEGLQALEQGIPGLFNQVFRRTHAKFEEDRVEMKKLLSGSEA